MKHLSKAAQSIWAKKSSRHGNMLWLPLCVHMADAAYVARRLWNQWLSEGVRQTIIDGIKDEDETKACQLFVFLSCVHDLGKATPVFQVKKAFPLNTELDMQIEEKIQAAGLPLRPSSDFISAKNTPHSLATQVLLLKAGCPVNAAVVLGSHHGKPLESHAIENYEIHAFNYHLEKEGKNEWTAVQSELLNYALEMAGFSDIKELPDVALKSQVLLSALIIMADWIASNEEYFPYIDIEDIPELLNYKKRVEEAWKKLSLPYPWKASNAWVSIDIYKERFGFSGANTMQSAVEQAAAEIIEPGIFVLEAPMGSGKTEAALACAEIFASKTNRSGVFFALPTQATSDGILPRMIEWINRLESEDLHTIELAHSKAQFNEDIQSLRFLNGSTDVGVDEEMGAFVHQWFGGSKKALLADFVVGTIDQLLLAALKQKHVMLRHLGLAGKVVIIDECHAYDAYMGQYLKRALNWLGVYKVPVIVLSATLPAENRKMVIDAYLNKDLITVQQSDPLGRGPTVQNKSPESWTKSLNYPLITYTDGSRIIQKSISAEESSLKVNIGFISDEQLADKLDELLTEGGCAGIIVNTVKRAQKLASTLSDRFGSEIVRLLHSQFITPDRISLENELRIELGKPEISIRPSKRIVIGTQVLEQSLDIDFDALFTDICPMDLLLQRIGRLHRHNRPRPEKLKKATCFVLGVKDEGFEEGSEAVYGKYLLMRTKAMLPPIINIPKDIPSLVQDVYDDNLDLEPEPAGYIEAKEKHKKLVKNKEKKAGTFRLNLPWPGFSYNLLGWLNKNITDQHGEAAVRDTDESIEVLLLQQKRDGRIYFLPWLEGGQELSLDTVPDRYLAMAIARQRIRLPRILCTPWNIDRTIDELERMNSRLFYAWQESAWLRGELILLLDHNFSAELCGYHLIYDKNLGLTYEREVGRNE
ncbi:MAG: CRISPR-associated helicase Cas3' [Clostridiales bacterium]|nr:CRISPR-associated helicase Cas3' [Clostridiales bacterium]